MPTLSRLSRSFTRPSPSQAESEGGSADESKQGKEPDALANLDASAILYPTFQTHPEPIPYPILVLSLPVLSGVPAAVTDAELFEYLLRRLDPWVGEEGQGGYVLVILAAVGDDDEPKDGTGRTWPSLAWWTWMLKTMPRR